jgi:hypothetical protein
MQPHASRGWFISRSMNFCWKTAGEVGKWIRRISHSYNVSVPTSRRMNKCIMWCSHMILKIDSDLWNFYKIQLMNFISDLERFITPKAYIMLCIHQLHRKMHFTSSKKLAHPVETQRGPYEVSFFVTSSLFLSWPACQVLFCLDHKFNGCITRCTFISSRKLAHPVDNQRSPFEDPFSLQLLAFFYLDLPAKFHFAGTMH